MRIVTALIFLIIICNINLSAQKNQTYTIKAGTSLKSYFPLQERYRYPDFVTGLVIFENGNLNKARLNLNYLRGEFEFIQANDTLSIARKKEIKLIIAAQDTFYYDHGFIEQIAAGRVKVGLKQYIKLIDILKKGAFGTTNRSVAIDSYSSYLQSNSISYNLVPDEDIVLQETREYYFTNPCTGFVPFTKKNVIQLFPLKQDEIKAYIKTQKVNFSSREDLLKLADYLRAL